MLAGLGATAGFGLSGSKTGGLPIMEPAKQWQFLTSQQTILLLGGGEGLDRHMSHNYMLTKSPYAKYIPMHVLGYLGQVPI